MSLPAYSIWYMCIYKLLLFAKEPKHRRRPLALWVMWLRIKALLAQEGLETWKLYRQTRLYEITIYRYFLVQNCKEMWWKTFNVGINCEMSLDDFSVWGGRSSISLVLAWLLWQHSSTTDILQEEEDKSWIYHWIYMSETFSPAVETYACKFLMWQQTHSNRF